MLSIKDIDAEDGTLVLDLKPYISLFDKPKGEIVLQSWVFKHVKEHHHGIITYLLKIC